jgi:hypothetical protein
MAGVMKIWGSYWLARKLLFVYATLEPLGPRISHDTCINGLTIPPLWLGNGCAWPCFTVDTPSESQADSVLCGHIVV